MSHSAVVGGSTAARIIACPPSRLSVEDIPEAPPTPYQQVGSALHEVMEMLFAGAKPHTIIGTKVQGIEITKELFDAKAMPAMKAFTQYVDAHPVVADVLVEQHVTLGAAIPGAYGTADVVLQHMEEITIIDWKFGDGVQVAIEENAQLLFYAAGVSFKYPWCDVFNLVIIQPNDRGEPITRTMQTDRLALFDFVASLRWAVNNGHRDELLNSGEHCRWCPARPVCPKLIAGVKALTTWTNPHPELTPVEVGDYLRLAENAQEWIDSVKQYAHERLEQGEKVDGYKLVAKRAIRKWKHDNEAETTSHLMVANPKMVLQDFFEHPTLMSPARMEKLNITIPSGLIEARSSGTTLARDDDSRDAVIASNPLRRLATLLRTVR